VVSELFDALVVLDPDTMDPLPSLASSWEAHEDGLGYTFTLREGLTWSDGTPLVAYDFVWSWHRVLDPAAQPSNATALLGIRHAELYRDGRLARLRGGTEEILAGTAVEIVAPYAARTREATDIFASPGSSLLRRLPAGTLLPLSVNDASRDGYTAVRFRAPCPDLSVPSQLLGCAGDTITAWIRSESLIPEFPPLDERILRQPSPLRASPEDTAETETLRLGEIVFLLEERGELAHVRVAATGRFGWLPRDRLSNVKAEAMRVPVRRVAEPFDARIPPGESSVTVIGADLLGSPLDLLGFRALDGRTLEVRLESPRPFFLQELALPPFRPVPPHRVERSGTRWSDPETLVTSGPFELLVFRPGDRIELGKSATWWGAGRVALNRVVLYGVESDQTSVNLYRSGKTDLVVGNDIPVDMLPFLQDMEDFHHAPAFATYFYRLNTSEKPFNDPRVRLALSMALDRRQIASLLRVGHTPASSLVPPVIEGYASPDGIPYDPVAARELLALAGYPVQENPRRGGRMRVAEKFPFFRILYNDGDNHRLVAQTVREQWRENLGIRADPLACDYATWARKVGRLDYDVTRGGWIADYEDPSAFLDVFRRNSPMNRTGWSSAHYDILLAQAAREPERERRMEILSRAESLFLREMPVIPIFWTEWMELRQPSVKGWGSNPLDVHPLRFVRIER
jgi:oligopeptide transport system substrate-binding protein